MPLPDSAAGVREHQAEAQCPSQTSASGSGSPEHSELRTGTYPGSPPRPWQPLPWLRPAPQGVCRVSVMVDNYARMLPIVGLPAGPLQHLCPCVLPAEAGPWRGTRVPRGELAPVLTGKARGLAVASVWGCGPWLGHLLGMGCCRRSWLKLHVRGP